MSAENSWEVPQSKDVQAVDTSDAEPSAEVFRKRQSLSDFLTILASGFALISDGYEYNLMTMTYYVSAISTSVSNACLLEKIFVRFLPCDYIGRKAAMVFTTYDRAASHGVSINGMLWMLNVSRGIIGFGTGGEYPPSSVSTASENANDLTLKQRGPAFIMLTNFQLSFGGPFAVLVSLVVFSACQPSHYSTVQRVCFRFRVHLAPVLPYGLVHCYYWKSLIGTCGAWYLYGPYSFPSPDFITFPNGVFSATIISSVVDDDSVLKTGEWQLLLGAISLPCVSLGALLYNKLSGENIMMVDHPLFLVFYSLMQSSGKFGPGDMLGLFSSELYATGVRGTCYGWSAAVGKVGGAIGTQAFTPIENNSGKNVPLIIVAIRGVVGILVVQFPHSGYFGDNLRIRDEKFRAYLVSKGRGGAMGDDDMRALAVEGTPPAFGEAKTCSLLGVV
ncbi:uncharacterized protein BO88DRAFT_466742 [Aspergillus vadensis CBS 113365]|uniref:MFS general substrate transporter n=1 Tax=Aspergillus vadensis (strain CBS 113365 / IMI 142717 / IBT 24658) TaxID=1448311 RepID=A0A319B403_ASPVC|nr:hypothetical protein BO88DRAFT_466742 [Aspergillus vadensis CBS 113365]PYH67189.1 hypothetical protein BO88DRAFT_466742 [Aspergillus vadensis CBS 113365]